MVMIDDDLKGSEVRLWKLIEERTRTGANTRAIDERIWDLFGQDAAVMFTDLSGFSRQVAAFGIIHFLQVIYEQKALLLPIVQAYDGILVKVEADSFLIVFRRPRRALDCAIAMQHACQGVNQRRVPEERILLCVGIGWGRILRIGDKDCYGAEVNAASKLGEDTAGADDVLVTGAVREAVGEIPGLAFEELQATIPGTDKAYRVRYEKLA